MEQLSLPMLPAEKKCSKCGESQPHSEFRKACAGKGDRHGLRSWCKACELQAKREYNRKNRAKNAAYSKRYREEHIEETDAYAKQYREEHKEEARARERKYFLTHKEQRYATNRRYAEKHREEILAYQRKYASQHREKKAEYDREYRLEHKEEHRRTRQKRRALLAKAPGSHTADDFVWLLHFYEVCPCCGEAYTDDNPVTEDHIVPLAWKGTSDSLDNIQPLCRSCNSRKGDRHATNYRDRVREFLARPDLHGPEAFMAVYRQSLTPSQSAPNTSEGEL